MSGNIPERMSAWVLYGKEDARFEEIPVPEPGPGEILVRIEAALTCGTDLKVFRRGYHALMIKPPAVFGHEFSGKVVRSESPLFEVGERIVAANSAPCGSCYFCGINKPNLCEDLLFVNGAYAEYLCVPARIVEKNCLKLDPALSAAKASLVEPLACAVKGVEDAAVKNGEKVLVIGAGPLGLMLARICVLEGAEVTCIDAQEGRLAVARELGVATTVKGLLSHELVSDLKKKSSSHGYGFDCVIEAIGRSETWNCAVELIRPGGRVNLFGGCQSGTELKVDATRLHYQELRIVATFHHTPSTVRKAFNLIAEGKVPAFSIVREGRSLFDLPDVFRELCAGKESPKVAIFPGLKRGERLSREDLDGQIPA